jgi:hypothetical protein
LRQIGNDRAELAYRDATMRCGGGESLGGFGTIELVTAKDPVEVGVVTIPGIEIAQGDRSAELLGDHACEGIAEERESAWHQLLRVCDDLRIGSNRVADAHVKLQLQLGTADRGWHRQPKATVLGLLADQRNPERRRIEGDTVVRV